MQIESDGELIAMSRIVVIPALCVALLMPPFDSLSADDELLPKHMTVDCLKATQKGLDHITKLQSPDGSFVSSEDGAAYPVAMTALVGLAYLAGGSTTTSSPTPVIPDVVFGSSSPPTSASRM